MERVLPHSRPAPATPWLPTTGAPAPGTPGAPGASRAARRRSARGSRPSRSASTTAARVLSRGAVLAALGAATIAFPVADVTGLLGGGTGASATALADGLTVREVLSSAAVPTTPTTLLAAGRLREVGSSVSRATDRGPLPGCDGEARIAASNGQIPSSDLCTLWDGTHALRGDAAVALTELNLSYRATFGRDLCLTDSYRPLAVQRRLAAQKPRLAATPGRSNHGWGLAIDLCSSVTRSSSAMSWLRDNGPTFGWDNPAWARRGGSGPYEPWHWEYVPGTTALGTDWS